LTRNGGIAVLGYGNSQRAEDGVGPAVVRRLAGRLAAGVELRELASDALALLAACEEFESVILVDAVVSGAAPGTVHCWEADQLPVADSIRLSSSHGLGLRDTIELGRRLGLLPRRLAVVGVEAGDFDVGAGIRSEVSDGIQQAAETVCLIVDKWTSGGTTCA
jgi:hydrogenase maturation protease